MEAFKPLRRNVGLGAAVNAMHDQQCRVNALSCVVRMVLYCPESVRVGGHALKSVLLKSEVNAGP